MPGPATAPLLEGRSRMERQQRYEHERRRPRRILKRMMLSKDKMRTGALHINPPPLIGTSLRMTPVT
jgi:hypothetical protein